MEGRGGDGSRLGQRFSLPDDILSLMPTDPYEQLDLAHRITSMAVASLKAEMGSLRQNLSEKDGIIEELNDTVARLDGACRIANEDNARLLKEKDSLALTVKKLSRDLGKLEAFKRQLMQSLNDDNYSQAENVGIECHDEQWIQKANSQSGNLKLLKYEESDGYSSTPNSTVSKQALGTEQENVSSGLTPKWHSASDSPTSFTYSPRGLSSSQNSPATNSPRSMPGREFFRQARSRLSLEQFSAFLANVKDFNTQKQSRQDTLKKADDIFGPDNKDLYLWFQGLLNRTTMH